MKREIQEEKSLIWMNQICPLNDDTTISSAQALTVKYSL